MPFDPLAHLARIRTVAQMAAVFQDEDHCRRYLEAPIRPRGRHCPSPKIVVIPSWSTWIGPFRAPC